MTKGKDIDGVISGYLDVKVPARSRKRPFGPWKCWRRHWVEARESGYLVLSPSPDAAAATPTSTSSSSILTLPAGATLCRTASRSRQYAFGAVSHGGPAQQQHQQVSVYLAAKSEAEAERWMSALRGIVLALRLPPRITTSPALAPAAPIDDVVCRHPGVGNSLLRGRRLSRSESDLLGGRGLPVAHPGAPHGGGAEPAQLAGNATTTGRSREASPSNPFRGALRLLHGRRRADTLRDTLALTSSPPSPLSLLGGKIASGLISAGLGLMLSTPGGSEVEDNDEEDHGVEDSSEALDRRRESGVSVASGVYEEIKDNTEADKGDERLYENTCHRIPRASGDSAQYEDPALLWSPEEEELRHMHGHMHGMAGYKPPQIIPPPLPPRSNLAPISKLLTSRASDFEDYVSMQKTDCVDIDLVKDNSQCRRIHSLLSPMRSMEQQSTEPDYLPMSPARTTRPIPVSETTVNINLQNILQE